MKKFKLHNGNTVHPYASLSYANIEKAIDNIDLVNNWVKDMTNNTMSIFVDGNTISSISDGQYTIDFFIDKVVVSEIINSYEIIPIA